MSTTPHIEPAPGAEVHVVAIPGGPLIVRGAACVVDGDGDRHPTDRPVVALCACGRSARAPWCDSTHKFVRRDLS